MLAGTWTVQESAVPGPSVAWLGSVCCSVRIFCNVARHVYVDDAAQSCGLVSSFLCGRLPTADFARRCKFCLLNKKYYVEIYAVNYEVCSINKF